MRYDLAPTQFLTPRGRPVIMWLRESTNDHNTAFSCLNEDEYATHALKLSGLAMDIGGHVGAVAVGLALDNPDLRVICVEPVPENCALITRNLHANGVSDRVTLVPGLAGESGFGLVRYAFRGNEMLEHHAWVGNSTLAVPVEAHTVLTVPSYSLSDLVGQEDVSFIKIDCEGGEFPFFGDSQDALPRVELIAGEWHPIAPMGEHKTQADLLALLSPTHDVTFSGPEAGPGGFRAVRR